MRITFKRVWGKNFGSYEEFDFIFRPGKHGIFGTNQSSQFAESNGSGKSYLFESPSWCIYDKTLRDKNISRDKKGKCFVGMEFSIEGDHYEIMRTFGSEEGKKKNSITFKCNGENVSPRNNENIEDVIERTIGIPYDLFVVVVTVLQGLPVNLSTMTPTIRKTVLETMMGLDNWDVYNKLFQSEKKRISQEYDDLNDRYKDSEDLMIAKNSQVETFQVANEASESTLKEDLRDIKKQLSEARSNLNWLENKREMCSTEEPHEIRDKYNTIHSSCSIIEREIENLKDLLDDGICPTCGQNYPSSMIQEAEDKLGAFDNKLPRMQAKAKALQSLMDAVQVMDSDILMAKREIRIINAHMDNIISRMDEESKENTDNIEDLKQELEELVAEVNDLNEQLKQQEIRLEGSNYVLSLLLPSSTFRTRILERYLGYVNSILEEVSANILDSMTISLEVDKKANGIDIKVNSEDGNRTYKALSGGEKRRVDIIIILSLQRFLLECTGISTNLLVFDEIFDSLDNVGIQMILHCIDMIFEEDLCVYIITHKNDFRQSFESIIEIEKVNDISSIL